MRRLSSEVIARLIGVPFGRFRQQLHMRLYGKLGAGGFTLGDYVLVRLAHKLRDPGLPLGTAWRIAGGFAEPLALEMAEAEPHTAVFALVPHTGPQAPCTVGAEDLAEAMLDLLQSSSTVTCINLSELAEAISVEWCAATGTADAPRLRTMEPARLAVLLAATQAKLAGKVTTFVIEGTPESIPQPVVTPKVKA